MTPLLYGISLRALRPCLGLALTLPLLLSLGSEALAQENAEASCENPSDLADWGAASPEAMKEILTEYYKQLNQGCKITAPIFIQEQPDLPALRRETNDNRPEFTAFVGLCTEIFRTLNFAIGQANPLLFRQIDIDFYDENCTWPLSPPVSKTAATIAGRLGVVQLVRDGMIYCTATLISPSHAITALHCLRNPLDPTRRLHPTDINFVPMRSPDKPVPVQGFAFAPTSDADAFLSGRSKDQRGDYALLQLAQPQSLPEVAADFEIGPRQSGDELIVPGFNFVVAYRGLEANSDRAQTVAASWPEFFRFDGSGACQIERSDGPGGECLVHSCQTVGGMSGAPVLSVQPQSGKVTLFAIHSGALDAASCQPRTAAVGDRRYAFPNVANSIDFAWIASNATD